MASIQNLLNDIDLRYKNTFTTDQKLVWMNEEQRELFETLEVDSVPFSFSLVADQYLYPIPNGVEKDRIKVMTIQVNDQTPASFEEIPFIENNNNREAFEDQYWYTIVENNFYINTPSTPVDGRLIYIYLDAQPEDLSSTALNIEPSVPIRYQELLKLGTLKRIAAARKDTQMYNNYDAEYQQKIADLEWKMKMQEPEFITPTSTLPRRTNYGNNVQVLNPYY